MISILQHRIDSCLNRVIKIRRKGFRLLLVILFIFLSVSGFSTVYYVSSTSGNDGNSGTSENSAWRSLDKVNGFTPKPGDQILFKRGDSWTGTITVNASGTSGSPIVYGAYGSGDKPKIYGSEIITGWTRHSGNIWKATIIAGDVKQIFMNDDRMQLARYPDKGYFNVTSKTSNTVFTSGDLDGGTDYTGATCFIKSNPWAMPAIEVSGSSSQTITLASAPMYGVAENYGFWLVNKLEFLTQAGEWYYDSGTNTLYFWTLNGDSPDNYMVRASTISQGIYISKKGYITVQDIELAQSGTDGVYVISSNNIQIKNCSVTNPDRYGIYEGSNNKLVIDNNSVNGASSAIRTWFSEGTVITNNLIQNTGQIKNYNKTTVDQDGMGMFVRGNNHVIHYNRIINTGYIGIASNGLNVSIKYNYVDGACQVLDDGAGIYVSSSSSGTYPKNDFTVGTIIEGNIITNVHGVIEGKPSNSAYPHGNGIYLDWSSKGVTVKNNTVNFVSQGIYIQGGGQNVVEGNIFMDGMLGYRFNAGNEDILFSGNIVYQTARLSRRLGTISPTAYQILVYSNTGTYGKWLFNDNIYVARYTQVNQFRYTKPDGKASFASNFSDWKNQTGQDVNSTFIDTPLKEGETEQLLYNDTKQPKTFNLGTTVYRDIFGNEVTGKLTLEPFTSKIVIKTTKTIQVNQSPVILDQMFSLTAPLKQNDFIGQVVASDPDAGQTLSYSITQGNGEGMFFIQQTTGELYANKEYTSSNDQTFILIVEVTDNADSPQSANAEITIHITGTNEEIKESDNISPVISSFSIPSESSSLTVIISSFEASDNVAIAGYKLTETETAPLPESEGWTSSAPNEYTFAAEGSQILYAWVKDAAGNVSNSASATVTIKLPDLSYSFSEYLFEETSGPAVIDSKCSNDGTLLNEYSRVGGALGNGLELSGSGYVSLGQCFGENVQDEVTLSAWIKPNANSGGYQGIIMHGGPNTDTYALYIYSNTKTIGFKTSGTTSSWFTANVDNLWDGNWHHVAVVYNGTEKIIYVDNIAVATIEASGKIDSGFAYNLLIGAGRDETNPTLLYNGKMDEVRIYNYALTYSEVGELYHPVNRELNKIYTTEDITICEGEEYMGWTQTGQYERVLQRKLESTSGADSIVTTNLTVNSAYTVSEEVAIYEGENYMGWTEEGTYQRNLVSTTGCDSIVVTSLNVMYSSITSEVVEICEGDSYNGWTETGQYERILQSSFGGDIIVITHLTVHPSYTVSEDVAIYEGEDYMGWTEEGIYQRNLISSAGCDSTVTTNLTVLQTIVTSENVEICQGDSYNGWSESGRYERLLQSTSGADSIIVTILTVNPSYSVSDKVTICEGESYKFGSLNLTKSGKYTEVFETIHGCDSTVTLTLTVNPMYQITEEVTIYEGDNYFGWTEEGTYQRNLVSTAGCDSIVVTNLRIEKVIVEQNAIHSINLVKGWNIISSYLTPSERNMESVMESLRNDGYLVKVADESSNTYERKNRNFPWVNNIGDFLETEGYRIEVSSNCVLEINGQQVSLPFSIPLKGGTNIISFPVNGTVDAMKVIQPLIDAGVLNKVQDEKGNSIENWRNRGWINGIGNFEAGKGYIVQVSSDAILTINESYTKSAQVLAENPVPTYFKVNYDGNGIDHMNINVVELANSPLSAGDEIAVFDNGICVGAVKLAEHNFAMDAVSIPASAKEGGMNNGYSEGHSIELRVWSKELNEEISISNEIIEGELVFNKLGSVFVALAKDVSVNADGQMDLDSGIQIYPNPAQNYVNVRFSSMPETDTRISLFDISGRQMRTVEAYSSHEVIHLDDLPSGIYFIKTFINNRMETHKLIKR